MVSLKHAIKLIFGLLWCFHLSRTMCQTAEEAKNKEYSRA